MVLWACVMVMLPAVRGWSVVALLAPRAPSRRTEASLVQAWSQRAVQGDPGVLQSSEDGCAGSTLTLVRTPAVRYTVPQTNRGWKGRLERGEDQELWYDDEGARNGPPSNYWRQTMDELVHRNCVAAIDQVLARGCAAGDEGSALAELERSMAIQKPLRSRKLLGRWAVLLYQGRVVAQPAPSSGGQLRVAVTAELRRLGARKTIKHRYGLQDVPLEEGEQVLVRLTGLDASGTQQSMKAVLAASGGGGTFALPLTFDPPGCDDEEGSVLGEARRKCASPLSEAFGAVLGLGELDVLRLGGVSLMNDYIVAMRDDQGQLTTFLSCLDNEPAGGDA